MPLIPKKPSITPIPVFPTKENNQTDSEDLENQQISEIPMFREINTFVERYKTTSRMDL